MFVTQKNSIGKYARPLIPAIDPVGSNETLFLTDWNDRPLTEEVEVFGIGGYTVTTAPILTGIKVDLMANSCVNLYIQQGITSVADTINPSTVRLQRVYIEVLGELFAIDVSNNETSAACPDLIGDSRGVKLDARGSINFDRETKTIFGESPIWRSMLLEQDHSIFAVEWYFTGSMVTSRGDLRTCSDVSITMGGAPKDTRTPFQILLERNSRVVAFTLNAYIG